MREYGIQMYSVRDITEKDMPGALRALAEMGYKNVEFAGFFGIPAEEIKKLLDDNGLKVSGTHTGWNEIAEHFEETVAYHKAIGNTRIIIPGADLTTKAKLDAFIDMLNEFQPKLAAEGITLGYHNHDHEFKPNEDGQIIYDENRRPFQRCAGNRHLLGVCRGQGSRCDDGSAERPPARHSHQGRPVQPRRQAAGTGHRAVAAVYAKAVELNVPMVVESETLQPDGLTEAKICIDYLKSLEK